ncbi:MAG: TrkH family potassium uptake protein [Smithellaceae bacterium]
MKHQFTLRTFFSRHLTPARIFVLSFAGFILAGALVLWLPSSASGDTLRFVDALFTAASAVCVTGLVTIDIGQTLSLTGQIITLTLFQVGGLGIITFSILLFALMGRRVSFKGREITQATFLHSPRKDIYSIVKRVLLYTLIIEFFGTLFLFVQFIQEYPLFQALYVAIFHAVSAFNNAGFSLFSDSLMRYQSNSLVNVTIMLLIILGGIGFIVQQEVVAKIRGTQKKLSLHTKIVLIATVLLILLGAACFYFMEMNNVLRGETIKTALLSSFFQSITSRTAGFNTVDIGILSNSTLLLMMALMFIGASPGSAGGGVKTTSFAILLLLFVNRIKGRENVNVANRTIPRELVDRTISIVFASAIVIGIVSAVLLLASGTSGAPLASRYQFIEYIFEAFSAFGTVGLSMGATPKLNDIQKYAIIFMMFIGRVGPLTLAFAWYSRRRKGITYAEESVMVG